MEGWIQQAFECLQTPTEHCVERKSPVVAEENKIEVLQTANLLVMSNAHEQKSNEHSYLYSILVLRDWCAVQTVQIKNKSRNEIFIPINY